MAPPITFHLNACSVSSGIQARDAKCTTEDCLLHMRSRPIVSSGSSASVASAASQASNGISLRFRDVPAPVTAPAPPGAEAVGLRFDFASLLSASVGNAAQGLEVVGRLAPAPVADAARALHARIVDKDHPSAKAGAQTDVSVFIDQYEIGERDPNDPSKPLKRGCSRFLEVVRGVLCTNPATRGDRGQPFHVVGTARSQRSLRAVFGLVAHCGNRCVSRLCHRATGHSQEQRASGADTHHRGSVWNRLCLFCIVHLPQHRPGCRIGLLHALSRLFCHLPGHRAHGHR